MKTKQLIRIALFLLCLNVYGQTSITLTFKGKLENTSTSVKLDSILIENLNNYTESVFVNKTAITITLNSPNSIREYIEPGISKIYPNPFDDAVNIEYAAYKDESIVINVFNLSGQSVYELQHNARKGLNHFVFTSAEQGVYFIKIKSNEQVYTSKVICISKNTGEASVVYREVKQSPVKILIPEKSSKKNKLVVNKDDQLKFTGYSTQYVANIYDLASISKSYEFVFPTKRSFHFEKHLIQTAAPCFVNIMFSVKDDVGVGVDYLSNKDFKVLEDNTAVSPSESSRYVKNINQIPYTLKTVVMLDNSSSLTANDIEKIKTAAISLVQSIGKNQEIAIYVFSSQPVLLQDFTSDVSLLTDAINSIKPGFQSTNLYGSIIKGLSRWDNTYNLNAITQGYLIVFSDADDTQSSSTLAEVLSAKGNKKIYMIGLGNDLDKNILNQIAAPSSYIPVTNTSDLAKAFAIIQNDILRLANSFYWLNYMSPKRTSTHTLRVEAVNNSNTGSDSYIEGSFPAGNFQDVYPGVFANVSYKYSYGLDYIKCNYESSGRFRFYNSNKEILADDSLLLEAATFGAKYPPEHIWTLDDNTVVQLKQSSVNDSKAWLVPLNYKYSSANITLEDNANGFTQDIYVNITSDLPSVTTDEPTDISYFTATCGGNVLYEGKSTVTASGVCWSKYNYPDIYDSKTNDGQGTGAFTSNITGLDDATTYFIRAYATNSYGTAYGEEYTFKTLNKPPTSPSNPNPVDAATGVTSSNLSWQCSDPEDDPLTYDFYIGTSSNPPLNKENINVSNFAYGKLKKNTKYYWKIIAKDNNGNSTPGPVWSFTTNANINNSPSEPSNPNPANGTTGVALSRNLSWSASTDFENDPITYDVYFGKTTNPGFTENVSTVSYTPVILNGGTKYYWKIVAKDNKGNSTPGAIWSFSTENESCGNITDKDGNVYNTVKIGTQCWMKENLKTTKYKDGTSIPYVTDNTAWMNLTTPGYCWYDNDAATNKSTYGALYNWYAVNTLVLCPTGWHVPSNAEWFTMENYIDPTVSVNCSGWCGTDIGSKLKEAGIKHWYGTNEGATNESGFTALPGGSLGYDGYFSGQGSYGYWWTATETYGTNSENRYLYYDSPGIVRWYSVRKSGYSVRCIKD